MQPTIFLGASLLSLLALTAAQTTTITVSPAQASHISADIASYLSTLTTQPGWVSAVSVLATAIPSSDYSNGLSAYLQQVVTATALPSWYTAMPSDVQSIFSSVGAAEVSIVTKDLAAAAPQPTAALKVMGGMLAAGAAGLALL
ncbi:hypothetical protein MMC34_003440 [Xylographa carneopallida]|nr:hypothetical protein [Xylographa carneopallida]